jgi:adenylate kinase
MIIAISGTPGTGKTSVAENLEYPVIGITEFAEENQIGEMADGEREIDTEELVTELEKEAEKYEDLVIEGHLAHHFPADYCIILRCRPDVLRERLSERSYSDQKIEENVEAEAMDLILSEAVPVQEKIIEADTTERNSKDVADEIRERIENGETGYGEVDWTEFL